MHDVPVQVSCRLPKGSVSSAPEPAAVSTPKNRCLQAHMSEAPFSALTLQPEDDLGAWDRFVEISPQGTVFCQSFWLKATAGSEFSILTIQRDGQIVAGIPLPYSRSGFRGRTVAMPALTQTLGVLLAPSGKATYERRLSDDIEATSQLVNAIPEVPYFNTVCNYNFRNWTPFFWEGYQQTTSYTYVLHDISDIDRVVRAFGHSKRESLRKASKIVTIGEDITAGDFFQHHEMSLGKVGQRVRYRRDLFARLVDACYSRDAGRTFFASDKAGHIHATLFIVYDRRAAYHLVSSLDPEYRTSGALTLLIKHAIEYSSQRAAKFDFEGSMIRGVESSYRWFGGELMPYSRIWRDRRSQAERLLQRLWVAVRT